MINLRFKNPYKVNKEIDDEHYENDGDYFKFGDIKIYEYDYNNELASKGIFIFTKSKSGQKN
jgi:hypothetical protein